MPVNEIMVHSPFVAMTDRPHDPMRSWFLIATADLFLAAVMGVLLRAMYIVELPFVRFRPWMHGHSHTALFGWLFIGVVVVLLHDGGRGTLTRTMRWLLIGLQLAVLVMLFSFPLQGYGAVSITASSLHLALAYAMLAIIWRVSAGWPAQGGRLLTRWAIGLFVLSTLGIWAIGPIMATGNQGKEIYFWSVQFYLHFQFNGWFWFAAMALGVRWGERMGFDFRMDRLTLGLWVASAVLTFALAIAWSEPLPLVFATVSIGVLLQVWAAYRTLGILRRLGSQARERFSIRAKVLIGVALVSMALKVLVQAAVAVPTVAIMAFTIRHYVMGFIHMNTLGTMTMLLFAYAILYGWFDTRQRIIRIGLGLVIVGIIISELLLFGQGTAFWAGWGLIPGHYWHLALASLMIPVGTLLLLTRAVLSRRTKTKSGDLMPSGRSRRKPEQ